MTVLLTGYRKQKLLFRVYAAEIPATERRIRNRISHVTAADLLGAALAEDFGIYHAKIRRRPMKKPVLLHEGLFFNLSHCKGLAVCAVGYTELGIDAEGPRTVKDRMLDRVCTANEAAYIRAAENREEAFSRFWTLKEAYAKYTGEGLALDFSKLDFSFGEQGEILFHHPKANAVQFFQIRFQEYDISLCCGAGEHEDGRILLC